MATYSAVPIEVLETERLLLRPLREADASRIQQLFPNINVLRYMNAIIPWPYPPDGAEQFLQTILPKMAANEEYYWGLFAKGSDEGLMGVIGLTPSSETAHRGFWLGEPYWRRGYMTEAVAAVNDWAFDRLGMNEILVYNAVANVGSHQLKANSGGEVIGYGESDFVSGRLPAAKWRITADAWRLHRERACPE
ncbi:MAG TPA: GNAT family N-acetyltransferase [Fimbriimonas sp.]|nr:GNAT family N-acetyltransferase [Fimbriimonas sp.]